MIRFCGFILPAIGQCKPTCVSLPYFLVLPVILQVMSKYAFLSYCSEDRDELQQHIVQINRSLIRNVSKHHCSRFTESACVRCNS